MNIWLPVNLKSVKRFKESIRETPKKSEALEQFFREVKYPIIMGFHFVLPTKGYYKYTSLINLVVTGLKELGFIKNDSIRHINPVILPTEDKQGNVLTWFSCDRKNSGVNMSIIKPHDIIAPPPKSTGTIFQSDDVAPDEETMTLKTGSILG